MSDMPDGFLDYSDMGQDNPFLGLGGYDDLSEKIDPFEKIERDVLDTLGISSFDEILITSSERNFEEARGNRFESIKEAIIYLFDSGVLQFSGVAFEGEEMEIEIAEKTDM